MARYLRATYTTTVLFKIPEGIEADQFNTDVKWNTLFITQDDGEELEIEAEDEPNTEFKYPDRTVLLDEDFNRIEEEEKEKEEEEEHDWNCSACEDFFDAGKEQCKKCDFDFSLFNKEEEDSDDNFDSEDCCDVCVKGWSKENEFGRCTCRCYCRNLLRNCRYECKDFNELCAKQYTTKEEKPIEEEKEKEEEEEHDWNCSACEDFFDAGKEQCKKCDFDFSLFNKEEEESKEKEEYDWDRSKTSFNYLFAGRIDKRIEELLGQ